MLPAIARVFLVKCPVFDNRRVQWVFRRIMIVMSKHRIPRWMNVVRLVFVFGVTLAFLGVAILRGYDFVQTVGFLFGNSGLFLDGLWLPGLLFMD
jgi:hypothetical protein